MMLIQNDEMAQAAFHVSEALKFALTHYRYSIHSRKGNKLSGLVQWLKLKEISFDHFCRLWLSS